MRLSVVASRLAGSSSSRRLRSNPGRTPDAVRERVVALRTGEADAPNEVWQSDMTHWRLAHGTEVELCSGLDDHSRYLLECTACGRVDGDDVAIVDEREVTVVDLGTGEILSSHLVEPDRGYWQPTTRPRPVAGVPSDEVTSEPVPRMSPMSRLICRPCRDS